MLHRDCRSLWRLTATAGLSSRRFVSDASGCVALADLAEGSSLGASPDAFRGRSVLISTDRQLPALLALLQLDGVARRVVLCPPDLAPVHLRPIIAESQVDTIVSDGTGPAAQPPSGVQIISYEATLNCTPATRDHTEATEGLLL